MELDELKVLWNDYDRKLDKSLIMNKNLFRELNLTKAKSRLRSLLRVKIVELIFQFVMGYFLIHFSLVGTGKAPFTILALTLLFFVVLTAIYSVRQIGIIVQINFDYSGAIAPLQKKLEKLRILLLQYVKLSYLPIPLSPLFTVLGAEIWFNYDFFANANPQFWLWSVATGVLLIPVIYLLFYQLNKREIKPFWVRYVLNGSGWGKITAANTFLKEIEEFERED
ncbi:hypothetical protein GCM10027299_44640 [Larkinella ripae]